MYELPQDEWVVIFYRQTGATRLCPTLDFAYHHVSSKNSSHVIYRNPGDFRQRHDHHTLEDFWKVLHKNASWALPKRATGSLDAYDATPPDTDTESFCKLLWKFMQDVGDRLSVPSIKVDKSKEHYEFKLGLMDELTRDKDKFSRYNNQAQTLFRALLENEKQFMNEEDIKRLILRLVAERKLKTRQEPWVVFQYYRPQFIKDGYIIRGRAPKKLRKE